jgi:hypothetical protein
MLKAREVRERLQGRVDPQVSYCIEALAEQQHVMSQKLVELAGMFDQLVNLMDGMTQIAANMKSAVDTLSKKDSVDDVGDATH